VPSIEDIRCLIKFMPEKYIDSFLDEGLLYMNTLHYFRTYEDSEESLRGDEHEGLSASYSPEKIQMSIKGKKLEGIISKIDERPLHVDEIKLFCMTALTNDILEKGLFLDSRFLNFGDKAVVIEGQGLISFFEKLRERVKDDTSIFAIDSSYKTNGLIEYIDRDEHHTDLTVFHKFKEYSWQHEFRIAFERPYNDGHLPLRIGSLRNIAYVADTKELLNTKFGLQSL